MEIKEIPFNSVKEFLEYISGHNDSKIRLFRGQRDDWSLDSKLLRLVRKKKQIDSFFKIENRFVTSLMKTINSFTRQN